MARGRRRAVAGVEPLTPRQKWRAILLSTLLLVPAYLAIVVGVIAAES